MMGGHLDSALDGPGINDNGSGVATLLAIAAAVAGQPQPAASIRFGFWAAEEFGDLGSADYVNQLGQSDRTKIDAYFNLDMVGSPNPGRYVYDNAAAPAGSSDITQRLLAALSSLGAPGLPMDMGAGSDHYAFEQAGVPIGGVFSGLGPKSPGDAEMFGGTALAPEDPCYHLACDTRDNVDLPTAATLGQALALVLGELAY
jgi:Zn-dependent M28 family amino/carboxypeptidase